MADSITAACTCGKRFKVPASLAGKKGRCKGCGEVFSVPSGQPVSAAAAPSRAAGKAPKKGGRGGSRRAAPRRGVSGLKGKGKGARVARSGKLAGRARRPVGSSRTRSGKGRPEDGERSERPRSRPGLPRKSGSKLGLIVAAAVVTLLVAGGGITMAVTGWTPWGGSASALAYLPEGVDFIAAYHVREAMEATNLGKEMAEKLDDGLLREFKELDFDPTRDITAIYLAGDAGSLAGAGMLILIEGNLSEEKLGSKLKEKIEGTEESYEGHTLYVGKESPFGPQFAATWLESNLLAIGDPETLKKSIDAGAGRKGRAADNDAIAGLLDDVDQGALAWVVAAVPSELQEQLPPEANGLTGLMVATTFDNDIVTIDAVGRFTGEDGAKGAQEAIETALKQFEEAADEAADAEGGEALTEMITKALTEVIVGKSIERSGNELHISVKFDASKAKSMADEQGL